MKCTNRKIVNYIMMILFCLAITGCGAEKYDMAYDRNSDISSFRFSEEPAEESARGFAADLCVTLKESVSSNDVQIEEAAAALLCDLNKKEILYGKNQYEQMEPASLTKVMTALVALNSHDCGHTGTNQRTRQILCSFGNQHAFNRNQVSKRKINVFW